MPHTPNGILQRDLKEVKKKVDDDWVFIFTVSGAKILSPYIATT
jgi:hypothetical protein